MYHDIKHGSSTFTYILTVVGWGQTKPFFLKYCSEIGLYEWIKLLKAVLIGKTDTENSELLVNTSHILETLEIGYCVKETDI